MLYGTYSTNQIRQMVIASAVRQGVDPNLALAVATHESSLNPNAVNHNTNGTTDWGVMQLNDTTVQTLGVVNPTDPQQNIDAGVGLLAHYDQVYNGDQSKILWAYAAGPGSVQRGSMPSSVQSYIGWVDNWIYTNGSNLDVNAATGSVDPNSVYGSGTDCSITDTCSGNSGGGLVGSASETDQTNTVLMVALAVAIGAATFWKFFRG